MTDQKTATTQAHSSISDEGADAHERPVEQPPAGGMLSGASLTEPASLAALCAGLRQRRVYGKWDELCQIAGLDLDALLDTAERNTRLVALLRRAGWWLPSDTELYQDIVKELKT